MESSLRSRKRKQRPSNSVHLDGIFTRSRSQIYLHKNRSGHARPDSYRTRHGHTSVKDLRTRRVFSPATITDNDDDDVDLKGESEIVVADVEKCKKIDGNPNVLLSSDGILGFLDSVDSSIFDSVREKNDDLKDESETVVDLSVPDSVRENDVLQMTPIVTGPVSVVNEVVYTKGSTGKSQSSVTNLRGRKKVFKSPSSFSYRRMLPLFTDMNDDSLNFEIVDPKLPEQVQKSSYKASNMNVVVSDCVDDLDDCVQTTPPDSDVYGQSKSDKSLGGTVKPTSKPALNSCSRMNVLQNPTSFSHRRLLPYLMSVSGNNLSTLKSNQSLKLEKVTEENGCQNVSMNESKTDGNSWKPSTTDEKSDSPTSTLIPVNTSFKIMKTVTSVSSERILDAGGPDTDFSGSTPQLEVNLQAVKAVKSDSSIKLEQSSPKNNLESVEVAVSKAIVMSTEQSIDTNDGKERPHQSSLQITPVNALGVKSGILKRTPRGCRGICNCLNCTSFRLHAERSFEFSRNQMHDAEDVALELINDLSSLRTILEKTASDCKSLDTDKEKQVKEACEKALYKEEVARALLAQMNEDLSIHCRSMKLLRPNVTFANKTEEKVISRDHVYEKKSI